MMKQRHPWWLYFPNVRNVYREYCEAEFQDVKNAKWYLYRVFGKRIVVAI